MGFVVNLVNLSQIVAATGTGWVFMGEIEVTLSSLRSLG